MPGCSAAHTRTIRSSNPCSGPWRCGTPAGATRACSSPSCGCSSRPSSRRWRTSSAGRHGWTVLLFAPLAIAIASGPAQGVMRGDADVTMAVFLATGVLCLGLWVERARPGLLPAAALLLGAAANVKNEGTVFAIAVMVVALCASIGRPARDLRALGLAAVAVVAAAVPWRLWVAAHGPFPSDVRSLGDSSQPHPPVGQSSPARLRGPGDPRPARRRHGLRAGSSRPSSW